MCDLLFNFILVKSNKIRQSFPYNIVKLTSNITKTNSKKVTWLSKHPVLKLHFER